MPHMPGDEDWLIDDEDDFDPLEDEEPIAGPGYPDEEAVVPEGAAPETEAEWAAKAWQDGEKGQGNGYSFQRFRDPKETFAKVVFEFADQPPPHAAIEAAAGAVWRLETTRVVGRRIEAFYVRK